MSRSCPPGARVAAAIGCPLRLAQHAGANVARAPQEQALALQVGHAVLGPSHASRPCCRIAELEAAAAATLHVNKHLNKEIEKCIRGAEAAQAECRAWRERAQWLRKQLVQANKQQRALAAGQQEPFDEATALAELLASEDRHAEEAAVAHTAASDAPAAGGDAASPQPSESQAVLIRKLVSKGAAAGWLIDPTEVRPTDASAAPRHPSSAGVVGAHSARERVLRGAGAHHRCSWATCSGAASSASRTRRSGGAPR